MPAPTNITNIIKLLPDKTGIYQYYDQNEKLLYVGKAKNIKKRVASYFTKQQQNKKTQALLSKINDIKYIVVETEMDALLLENNLIKKHQPKYNVMLKDSKTYPWICIKKEAFPRVFQTRDIVEDGSEYFGPYTSVKLVKTLLDFFHELYPLRNCNHNLSVKNINSNKFKVCLEYHIGNCLGPCIGDQINEDYQIGINHIRQIIKGDIKSVIKHLKTTMLRFSKNMEFEKAQSIKDKIALLNKYQVKSTIVNPKINNIDVFSIISDEESAFVNYLKINSGAIIQAHTMELKKKLDETEEALLQLAIVETRLKFNSTSQDIYCSHFPENIGDDLNITIPKIGDKKKLIDLSLRNAKYMQLDKKKRQINSVKKPDNKSILQQLQKDLGMLNLPKHIECFDNSNIQGTNPVAACIVFKNAKSSKKDYRHFNIKTVQGPDDYASMEEVVYRRYKRLLDEEKKLPELIVIDGGKGQLSSAVKSLDKLNLRERISIIGIAKRLEEIYFPGDSIPLYLDKRSQSLKLIQQLRNEAHRFGISHHRKKRAKNSLSTSLDKLNGIGPKTVELLISHFGSVKKVKEAKKEDLTKLIGKSKANKILKLNH
ncbi:MAG: excinuclease ABC subunit C [Flavobacteriales bacterium]|nr:excinuclease ABC subunit C [Flavobacteriales bacterium]|tara:strand:- start:37134 stop:38927 length:1794 start_codon:yes stop_codon:yes gene_type:complete